MTKKRGLTFKILIPLILIVLVGIFVYYKNNMNQVGIQDNLVSPSPIPVIFPNQTIKIPNDWKTKNENFGYFSFSYRYPSNWFIEKKSGSGSNNYAILHSNDGSQCIGFTISSSGNLDQVIGYVVTPDKPLPQNSIIASQDLLINGLSAKIEQINYPQRYMYSTATGEFYAGAIDLGPDTRYPNSRLRNLMILTSCSLKEKDTLFIIFNSIAVK